MDKNTQKLILRQLTVAFCCAYTAIETPLDLVFHFNRNFFIVAIDTLISGIFLWDTLHEIILMRRSHSNEVLAVSKRQKDLLNSHYRDIWFYLNLLCSFPMELIGILLGRPEGIILFKAIKMIRLPFLFRVYQNFRLSKRVPRFFHLTLILLGVLSLIHCIACTWIYLNPAEGTPSAQYIKALYWSITTLTTTGYGDITPTTDAGRIFTMVVMILGFSAFGILVGNISNLLISKNKHEEERKKRIEDLDHFMTTYNVPESLQKEVFGFYTHLITKQLSEGDERIISDLPTTLKNELQIFMRIRLISAIPIFHDLSTACLKHISQKLVQVYFSPGDMIMKAGDLADEMYIIDHGDIEISSTSKELIATLSHGQCLGEMALLTSTPRSANAIARSYCDLYRFSRKDFSEATESFPEIYLNFKKIMELRNSEKK